MKKIFMPFISIFTFVYANSIYADNLPSGYSQLEYIVGGQDLNAYINLGFPATTTMQTLLTASLSVETNEQVIFGASNQAAFANGYAYAIDRFPTRCIIPNGGAYDGSVCSFDISTSINTVYDFKINYPTIGTIGVGNTTKVANTNISTVSSRNLYLFGFNGNNSYSTRYSVREMKFYRLKIWDNGSLIHDYVPARRTDDDVLGIYDTISGSFLTNAGSGAFSAPVITTVGLTWYDGDTQISGGPTSCTIGGTFVPPTPPARNGYIFTGWRIKEIHEPDFETCGIENLNVSINGSDRGFARLVNSTGYQESTYGLATGGGQWAIRFSYGTLWGMSNCNSTTGTLYAMGTPALASSGTKCWCQITGFAPSGSNYTQGPTCNVRPTSSVWVYYYDYAVNYNADTCLTYCANICANGAYQPESQRRAILQAVGQ